MHLLHVPLLTFPFPGSSFLLFPLESHWFMFPIFAYTDHNSFHSVAKHQGERDWRIISNAPQLSHLWLVQDKESQKDFALCASEEGIKKKKKSYFHKIGLKEAYNC